MEIIERFYDEMNAFITLLIDDKSTFYREFLNYIEVKLNNTLHDYTFGNYFNDPDGSIHEIYRISVPIVKQIIFGTPKIPNYIISNGPTFSSCGILSMMNLFNAIDMKWKIYTDGEFIQSNFPLNEKSFMTNFMNIFAQHNSYQIGTGDSDIVDVARSFADLISVFCDKRDFYSFLPAHMDRDFNFHDIFTSSYLELCKNNLSVNDISQREIFYNDIIQQTPKYVLIDSGKWFSLDFAQPTNIISFRINNIVYKLVGFIVNTGGHYKTILIHPNDSSTGLVYDNLSSNITTIKTRNYDITQVMIMLFRKQ